MIFLKWSWDNIYSAVYSKLLANVFIFLRKFYWNIVLSFALFHWFQLHVNDTNLKWKCLCEWFTYNFIFLNFPNRCRYCWYNICWFFIFVVKWYLLKQVWVKLWWSGRNLNSLKHAILYLLNVPKITYSCCAPWMFSQNWLKSSRVEFRTIWWKNSQTGGLR